jgi:diacylglycerol kinase family enzyme
MRDLKIAVLLNQNARKVNRRLVSHLKSVVPHAAFYLTETLSEANQALERIANGRYDVCFTGGGDGTICHAITRLKQLNAQIDIGILPLGTGNAIAHYLESPNSATCFEKLAQAERDSMSFVSVNSGSNECQEAAFGGFGWDAFILDHYYRWRDICSQSSFLKPFGQGLHAYFISGIGWAVPSMIWKRPRWQAKVYNGDRDAYEIDSDGNQIRRIPPRGLLYEGQVQILSFGTCPFFGFKMKCLPFATQHTDRMQLKIGDLSPLLPTLQLHKLWKGTFQHKRMQDFLVHSFNVELDQKAAVQLGGDLVGHLDSFEAKMGSPSSLLRYAPYQGLQLPKPSSSTQVA